MSIVNDLTNSNPMTLDGVVFNDVFTVASAVTSTPTKLITSLGGCGCECDVCGYKNPVFAEIVETDELKNDKSKFFGVALSTTSYVNFFLEKESGDCEWEEIAEITDSSLGTWRDVGYYTSQPKLATLDIFWREVLLLAGGGEGCYRVRVETETLGGGDDTVEYQPVYWLRYYSADRADNTVLFNWFQNGKIFNNKINFTGLNIEQWLRLYSSMEIATPIMTVDEIETSSHSFTQIQDSIEDVFEFESQLVDFYTREKLIKDVFLGNDIFVTSFSFFNHAVITMMKLKPKAIGEAKPYPFNTMAKIKTTFKPKTVDVIKRNYF